MIIIRRRRFTVFANGEQIDLLPSHLLNLNQERRFEYCDDVTIYPCPVP
jgi:hypothetical protein